jgi:hypothetical protein
LTLSLSLCPPCYKTLWHLRAHRVPTSSRHTLLSWISSPQNHKLNKGLFFRSELPRALRNSGRKQSEDGRLRGPARLQTLPGVAMSACNPSTPEVHSETLSQNTKQNKKPWTFSCRVPGVPHVILGGHKPAAGGTGPVGVSVGGPGIAGSPEQD